MIEARFKPMLEKPAPPAKGYRTSPFKATYAATLDLLERELRHLKASDIVIECDVRREDIRNDGWLRSSASVRANAVRLHFDSRHGALSYTCNTFRGWEANLRAIALTLEDLRVVEGRGALKGEQYAGCARLPDAAALVSRAEAVAELERIAGERISDPAALWRAAAFKAHPDHGGSDALMRRVTELRKVVVL